MSSMDSIAKIAISKVQKLSSQVPSDITQRVTALEMSDIDIETRLSSVEQYVLSGYSGSISVIDTINFTTQTITTKTITIEDGKIIGVA